MIKLSIDMKKKECTINGSIDKENLDVFAGESLAAVDKICDCFEKQIMDIKGPAHVFVFYLALLDMLNARVDKVSESIGYGKTKNNIKTVAEKAKISRDGEPNEDIDVSIINLSDLSDDEKSNLLDNVISMLKKFRK